MPVYPGIGGAPYSSKSVLVIRLILRGCANRPFYHINVMEGKKDANDPVIEQIGSFDPLPNKYNEKLVAINFKRLDHWIKAGAYCTTPVLKLLGLSGYFPIHPKSFKEAWENRKLINASIKELNEKIAALGQEKNS